MTSLTLNLFPITSPHFKSSSPRVRVYSIFTIPCPCQKNYRRTSSLRPNAVYTTQNPSNSLTTLYQRSEKISPEDSDDISILNERIRRDLSKNREVLRNDMDSEEAEKYIEMVKEQQQKGLQKLKGVRGGDSKEGFSYRVDPYTLHAGDYVVHKKVGVGRFVGIKFDASKDFTKPVEYVFIEYADGMAKLPVVQASKMLYRYNL